MFRKLKELGIISRKREILKRLDERILFIQARLDFSRQEEHDDLLNELSELLRLRESILKKNTVDKGTVIKVIGGVVLAAMILKFEKEDVISTKAFGVAGKLAGF